MQPLRYSINVTVDGCCDHRSVPADESLHHYAAEGLARNDAMLFGRATFELMESAFGPEALSEPASQSPDPFVRTIDAIKKYVVSSTLEQVGWNAELVRGDVATAVLRLKDQPGRGIGVGGVQLGSALAALGLIDEYEFIVHPRIAGHGPRLFDGLSRYVDLEPTGRYELASGAVALQYRPTA